MAYINFTKQSIVVLNAYESAAYVASCTTNNGKEWMDGEFDPLMEHGLFSGIIFTLSDPAFKDWFVDLDGRVTRYTVDDIKKGDLFYVIRGERTERQLKRVFSCDFIEFRTHILYATFYS